MATVYIGHASIDENGNGQGGTAGDQTGKEVCKRTWYSNSWDYIAIHPDEAIREKMASAMEAACANSKIGYDKNERNTLNTKAKAKSYNLANIKTACECDCSSLINVCCVAAGIGSYGTNGWTTTTLKSKLSALGFKILTTSAYLTSSAYCVRGAVYVRAGRHTVMGLTNGIKYATTLSTAGVNAGTITVDGCWGVNTTSKAQTIFGTTVDGTVSNQRTKYKTILTAIDTASWKFSSNGSSALVKAIQNKIGVDVDGIFGPGTLKAFQTWLGVSISAKLDVATVKAFQTWLNKQ